MSFCEVRFSADISLNSKGGPGFSTNIVELGSGAEQRTSRWSGARRQYDAIYGIKTDAQMAAVYDFYLARNGPAIGFRYKDWSDYTTGDNHKGTVDDEDVIIGYGDGSETQFQLVKKYTSGGVTRTRNITKPVSGTTVIAIDGASQGAGWTVDTTTGIVTFAAAPAEAEEITAGFQFDVPVRFGAELDEALWMAINTTDITSISSIPIVELIDETSVDEEFPYGGGDTLTISSDTLLSLGKGKALRLDPQSAGKTVFLPDTTDLPLGGAYFYLQNISATYSIDVKASVYASSALVTLYPDNGTVIALADNNGTKYWMAL